MKAAFTIWNDRVSPVFDVAGNVLLVEANQDEVSRREVLALPMDSAIDKLEFLSAEKVDVLVCGAISRPIQSAVEARGIKVYPFCSGSIDELVSAWLDNSIEQACYAMPGCGRGRCRNGMGNGMGSGRRCSGFPNGRRNQRNRRQ